MDSSPGFPYLKLGKKNADLFSDESLRGMVLSAVAQRVRRILQASLDGVCFDTLSPLDFVTQHLADPIKVFIKNEPHKLAKVRQQKFRLISNVSIVDQLIERALCSRQNYAEIAQWTECPSKPGMGLHDEGLQELYSEVVSRQRGGHILAETDISGWDWSVQDWTLALDGELRSKLYHAAPGSALDVLLRFRSSCVARKVFVLSDGSMFQQLKPGVQASGSYNTSSTNSRMRVLLGYLIGAEWVIAMGDDDVEDAVDGAADLYEELGYRVKDYKHPSEGSFEFCSTTFSGSWKGSPAQWARTVYRYLSHSLASLSANPGFRVQLANDLRHHPRKQEILEGCDTVVAQVSKRINENGVSTESS